jgi:RimJ/RimL family protein N-acetyltransferase
MLRDYIAHQEAHGFSFWAVIELASAFDDFGLDEVVAVADVANPTSTRVLERRGWSGRARQAYGRPHALYRVNRSGWRANSAAQTSERKK